MNGKVIDEYARRPMQYCNIDGLGELGAGIWMLGFGLSYWLLRSWVACGIAVFAVPAIIQYGTKAIRNRITYPRTGFVSYRRTTWQTQVLAGFFGAVVVVVIGVMRGRLNYAWLMTLFVPVYAYHFAMRVRWKWIVVLVLAAGLAVISTAPADLPKTLVSTMLLLGGVLFISGLISFGLYLRQTPPPAPEGLANE